MDVEAPSGGVSFRTIAFGVGLIGAIAGGGAVLFRGAGYLHSVDGLVEQITDLRRDVAKVLDSTAHTEPRIDALERRITTLESAEPTNNQHYTDIMAKLGEVSAWQHSVASDLADIKQDVRASLRQEGK